MLQILLRKRSRKRSALTIQSDLATVNLVDEQLRRRFTLRYAGCGSHARRPFARYEHEYPDYCAAMASLQGAVYCLSTSYRSGKCRQSLPALSGAHVVAQAS